MKRKYYYFGDLSQTGTIITYINIKNMRSRVSTRIQILTFLVNAICRCLWWIYPLAYSFSRYYCVLSTIQDNDQSPAAAWIKIKRFINLTFPNHHSGFYSDKTVKYIFGTKIIKILFQFRWVFHAYCLYATVTQEFSYSAKLESCYTRRSGRSFSHGHEFYDRIQRGWWAIYNTRVNISTIILYNVCLS